MRGAPAGAPALPLPDDLQKDTPAGPGEGAGMARWADAVAAAAIFCVDPAGIGGVRLRCGAGALRDSWFTHLRSFLVAGTALRRVPGSVDDGRLLGGIDLAATLRAGRPVAEKGLLAQSDGAVLVVPMAERMRPVTAALMAAVIDEGALRIERDGFSLVIPARIAVIACDEGIGADELPPPSLLDRLAFWIDINDVHWREAELQDAIADAPAAEQITAARARLARVAVPADLCESLCGACAALGIDSLRVPLMALRVARAAAALEGADVATSSHAALAARLVIAPRARHMPVAPEPEQQAEPQPAEEPPPEGGEPPESEPPPEPQEDAADTDDDDDDEAPSPEGPLAEVVLEAAKAALPADLLAEISRGVTQRMAGTVAGRTGVQVRSRLRGRPVGVRRGELRDGARLHVLETLRSAAPWQALRGRVLQPGAAAPGGRQRIEVRKEDFRIVRFAQRTQTTVIFVVDASGSAAMNRLAEAKGAVELFLADCYVRRDQVALIAFRGRQAEVLLPPTRSLARARRCLAGVPGGGGTPVAAGLRMAAAVADGVRRRGDVPLLVVLTDGKANVALDGTGGRERAGQDALAMARLLRGMGVRALLVDFSQRVQPEAQRLAQDLGARYLPLPRADAGMVDRAVRAARLDVR
jgi:magnesium chelatase subunit D